MATAAITNTFVAATAAEAAQVNTNFTDLVTFLNNSVVHVDGAKAMTAAFDAGTYRLTNVGAATAVSDAPRFDQTGISDYDVTSGAVTLPNATPTTVDTLSVTTPAAGLCLVAVWLQYAITGATFGGGEDIILFSVSSVNGTGGTGGSIAIASTNLGSNTTSSQAAALYAVPLASGANTITISATGTRVGASGGTATVVSGARSAVIGAF